jgi:hypothetical protein
VNSDGDVDFLLRKLTGVPADPAGTLVQLQEYKDGLGNGSIDIYGRLSQ